MQVDRHSSQVTSALNSGYVFAKSGEVRAEKVSVATPVDTNLADGRKETGNTAQPGDFIVTNPDGERYVLKPQTFAERYAPKPGCDGVYLAKGRIVAVQNPFGQPITIMASWGQEQHGLADCWFADTCDEFGNRAGEPYLIDAVAFASTYRQVIEKN